MLRRMSLKPSLEARARIATTACRGMGGLCLAIGLLAVAGGIVMANNHLAPIIGGAISIVIGGAFFVAKPITRQHLSSGIDDL
jgi:hypothetical protein